MLAHGAPLWTVRTATGARAAAQWRSLRAVFDRTGLWPVLLCDTSWHRIGPENGLPCTAALLGTPLDGAAWLTAEWQNRQDWAGDAVVELPRAAGIDSDPGAGDHQDQDPRFDTVALVPTPAPWYVPGLLQWSGAANYTVDEIGHSAVLRRWYGLWGAEPMALDDEWLTLSVGTPPETAAAGLTAALEIYLYCLDAVEQGAGSIDALAAMARQRVWQLWWD